MSDGDTYKAGSAKIHWGYEGRLTVFLPHQCGEWTIGSRQNVERMIADLQKLLPEFDTPEKYRHEHICETCGKPRWYPKPECPPKNKYGWGGCDWLAYAPNCYSCGPKT